MARRNFSEFILKIDYQNAKNGHNLTDLEHTARQDITFTEVKAAFMSFITKIGIKELQSRHTGPYWAAYTTVQVLTRLLSTCIKNDDSISGEAAETLLTVWIAMIAAGPNSTHTDMMAVLMNCTPKLPEYVQTLPPKRVAGIIKAMDITFAYAANEEDTESTYASFVYDKLNKMYTTFTENQLYGVHGELLHVYLHYHLQLPRLSPDMGLQINYLIRGMGTNFEDENPYLRLKDAETFRKHLTGLKDISCSDAMEKKSPVEETAERTLKRLVNALMADDKMLGSVFDHLMKTVVQLARHERAREHGDNLFDVIRLQLFRKLEDRAKPPSDAMFTCCTKMVQAIFTDGQTTYAIREMTNEALDGLVFQMTKASPEQAKAILMMVKGMIMSGDKNVVAKAIKAIDNGSYKGKVFAWKGLVPEAMKLIDAVGDIPTAKMGKDPDVICRKYSDFIEKLLANLKKAKVLADVQKSLIGCIFNCLQETTVHKAEIAEQCSDGDSVNLSKADKDMVDFILKKVDTMLKNKDLPWHDINLALTTEQVLSGAVDSYFGSGKEMTSEQEQLLLSIVSTCSDSDTIEGHFYQEEDDEKETVYFRIYRTLVHKLIDVHKLNSSGARIAPVVPSLLKWAEQSLVEDYDDVQTLSISMLQLLASTFPQTMKDFLPHIVDLLITAKQGTDLIGMAIVLAPLNPQAVCERLLELFDLTKHLLDDDRQSIVQLFFMISQTHAEVFKSDLISRLLEMYKSTDPVIGLQVLFIIRAVSEKCPKYLEAHFPKLVDDAFFKPESLNIRAGVIACVGGLSKSLGHEAIDYLMRYADYSDPTVCQNVIANVRNMVGKNVEHMQKHRALLENIEMKTTIPQVKETCHQMILIIDGKSIEDVIDDVQQQQEDIAELDTKVDTTISTVVTIGDEVVHHHKKIAGVEKGLEKVEERVDDAEVDIKDTKVKVEEIDNKTMTNAPKWSRDLTKLMNPVSDNDWRLLASRLGYSNDDIRGWAQQNDPCMALLSEWYATHKTSEASHAVLTALQEMDRIDGAVIVENAMKAAEGVVEDEEFEYASPPPIFLSYQWGMQEEVKLLQRHLNMAGYECWMDIGQMGGGDKLFAKIDNGIRVAKVVICCTTEKYAQSPNCNREVNLSVNLGKPIIPLLMEKMDWPPKGSMGPIFSEYLFIRFFQRGGEETTDQRYWPVPKFQELLMQLNFYVVPDNKLIQKEYRDWWKPMVEEIVIDKNKKMKTNLSQTKSTTQGTEHNDAQPLVFLSYQWGKQPQIKALYQRLTRLGYSVWMDIYQMGGGDSLYDKIDRGLRGCKTVVSCVTPKYSLSANCRREISLADALKKPVIPLLLEQMKWPPDGPMSMVFTELLYINFYRDPDLQTTWKGPTFDELLGKLQQHVPAIGPAVSEHTTDGKTTDKQTKAKPVTKARASEAKQSNTIATVAAAKAVAKSAPTDAMRTGKTGQLQKAGGASNLDGKATLDTSKPGSKSQVASNKAQDRSALTDKSTPKTRTTANVQRPIAKVAPTAASQSDKTKTRAKPDNTAVKPTPTAGNKATPAKQNTNSEPKPNPKSDPQPSKSCSIL